ncbi:NAD(P)-binding domain-containing protein, partial [Actinosynnema sp. NPDC023658]
MRIGVLGSGGMAGALGGRWVEAGHEVLVGGRSRERSEEVA